MFTALFVILPIFVPKVTATISRTTVTKTSHFSDTSCDLAKETYMDTNSPGNVPTLEICIQLCQESAQCVSITFYRSGWCSHFSSACLNKVSTTGATVVVVPPGNHNNWILVRQYGWGCDIGSGDKSGEVYLDSSSGKVDSLSACLDSCEQTTGCRSIAFYYTSNWCSHVSTACKKTKESGDTVSFTKPDTATAATAPKTVGQKTTDAASTTAASTTSAAPTTNPSGKCPPGKYTMIAGSSTAPPKCEICKPGFFKASTSISSTCSGAPSRAGKSHSFFLSTDGGLC